MGLSPEHGRVTAGLPALDPSVRFETAAREQRVFKQQQDALEVTRKQDAAVAPDGDRDRTAAVGYPMSAENLITKLAALNPSLQFRHHPTLPRFQIFVTDRSQEKHERYVCAFEDRLSPEFEVLLWHWEEQVEGFGRDANLKKKKVLDGTVRGWRTLLAILVREKLISKAAMERLFGALDSCSWQKLMAGH